MAWNRSSKNGEAVSKPLRKRFGGRLYVKGAIAAAIVVFGVAVAARWLWPKEAKRQESASAKPQFIKEVKPRISTNEQTATESLPLAMKRDHSELTVEELMTKVPPWAYTVEDRKRIDPGYEKRHERFLGIQAKKIWRTYADNAIAGLLFNKGNLGAMPPFPPHFKDVFLESIKTPIIVSKDDPPEVQEQKRQMIETKIWLKDQLDAGNDIVKILNEEYQYQRKASNLQSTLRRELYEIQKNAKSVEEVEDYVAAANKMLENAGNTQKIRIPTAQVKYRLQREAEVNGEVKK